MAGSWKHAVTDDGKLLQNEDVVQMLENGGDWYEFAEEAYGMVWWLATYLSVEADNDDAKAWVEKARLAYLEGLQCSPGTDGELKDKHRGLG